MKEDSQLYIKAVQHRIVQASDHHNTLNTYLSHIFPVFFYAFSYARDLACSPNVVGTFSKGLLLKVSVNF